MKKLIAITLAAAMSITLAACDEGGSAETMSYDDAVETLDAYYDKIKPQTKDAGIDIYDENTVASTLADIDTFKFSVEGRGEINLEIAAPSEMTGEAPDDFLNVLADRFNRSGATVGGKSVSISVRKISSGEVVTYMTEGDYAPDMYIPSSNALGEMLKAKGIGVVTLAERTAGNTAGILMEKKTYDNFIEKYKEATVANVLEATLAGDLTFAYTNPYTSATGLNILCAMLHAFDPDDPLSTTAQEKLLEYQRQSPPVAYTTGILRESAAKGVINAMVMEEQAYVNKPELKSYVYVPAGIRHDHPAYTFDYVSSERQEAAKLFVDYLLGDEAQKLISEKGFNLRDEYKSEDNGLNGAGYIAAQKIWKQNKDGGKPIIAVFVADVSGSMDGLPLNSLKDSLQATAGYIKDDCYIGLVSYSDSKNVNIELPVEKFDATQRAKFSWAVKNLSAGGNTATYDGVMVGLKMLLETEQDVPDAKLMLFVLSDGDQNSGYSLSRVTPVVGGLRVPIYSIGYNLSGGSAENQLKELSQINEAALINAQSEDLVNQLRNLFNVQL